LLCLVFIPATAAQADLLTLPAVDSARHQADMPTRGMSMQQVTTKFGQPIKKFPAVGDPPITRWKYAEYSVYFERQYVIHSVRNRR